MQRMSSSKVAAPLQALARLADFIVVLLHGPGGFSALVNGAETE